MPGDAVRADGCAPRTVAASIVIPRFQWRARAAGGAVAKEEGEPDRQVQRFPALTRGGEFRQHHVPGGHGAEPRPAGPVVREEQVAGAAHAEERPPRQVGEMAVLRGDGGAAEFALLAGGAAGARLPPRLGARRPLRRTGPWFRRRRCLRRLAKNLNERSAIGHDQPARFSRVGECRVSIVLPLPRYMWTPHGRHGSKLRTARMMSIPLKLSRPFSSKMCVSWIASSYGPGAP